MARIQQFAGGAFGAGSTIAVRETLGDGSYSRFTQPSVLWGLGTGAAATALWFSNRRGMYETPYVGEDFWGSHALTSIPVGLLYAALPAEPGDSTAEQLLEGAKDLVGIGDDAPQPPENGGTESVTVRRANPGRTRSAASGMNRNR